MFASYAFYCMLVLVYDATPCGECCSGFAMVGMRNSSTIDKTYKHDWI